MRSKYVDENNYRSLCGNNFFDGKYLNTEVFKSVSANDVTQTLEN